MNRRALVRRVLLLCAVLLVLSQVVPRLAESIVALAWRWGPECRWYGEFAPAEDGSFFCDEILGRTSLILTLVGGVLLAFLLAAAYPAVRWCLRPILDLADDIGNLGPQNLGYRLRPGSSREELAELGRAIDAMMDRVAVGYEAQRRFAADASHELRTPLAVQRTLIEVGMAGPLTADQRALLSAQLLATNERNERLIEGLLVLAESDRGLVTRSPQRLDRIVAEVLDAHRERAAAAGVTITSRLRPRVVEGEQVLLERLVTNLVQNALKYNRPGGTIAVEVGEAPALVVTNTGDDIPSEDVPGLFEPFRRRSGARIDHSGGAGLGLAIARSITRAHDGVIAAAANEPDGLRVQVSFPT
ncbi:HAMP domain-containing protein [Natronosporangium hydrolyticum]|uniref:histidine kinase n=1 Tax=Natronosporangium hydrolyticum TaxID=2811111 RepID=A0A895YN18_9ACTN|nr:ATP-binding protein [Natronosporangium hydrolyticum]QSB16859.1 HAMP domain-containing protein [Natronosporangium hydrolyticum]